MLFNIIKSLEMIKSIQLSRYSPGLYKYPQVYNAVKYIFLKHQFPHITCPGSYNHNSW